MGCCVRHVFVVLARGTQARDRGDPSRHRRASRPCICATTPKRAPTSVARCPSRRRGAFGSRRPGLGIVFVAPRSLVSRRDLVRFVCVPTKLRFWSKLRPEGNACWSPRPFVWRVLPTLCTRSLATPPKCPPCTDGSRVADIISHDADPCHDRVPFCSASCATSLVRRYD